MRLKILIVLSFLLVVVPGHAFQARKHETFSNHAAMIYKECTGRSIPKELLSVFAKGAVDEDCGILRAFNWHFYNNDDKVARYGIFYATNVHIFSKRIDELNRLIYSKAPLVDIYSIAGRIGHHIQDMSSPSHVLPIFHMDEDKFDKYQPRVDPEIDIALICKDIKGIIIKPSQLLELAAQSTQSAVRENVAFYDGKDNTNEQWTKFWGDQDDKEFLGFKKYGNYGNQFGVIPPCDSDTCKRYDNNTYDMFYNRMYMRAVIDTVRLFIYLDQRLTAKGLQMIQ